MGLEGDYLHSEINLSTDQQEFGPKAWMVRPCEWYRDEYRECNWPLTRLHQYFIHGKLTNCWQWGEDYRNCMIFRKSKDINAMNQVIQSEEYRYSVRMMASQRNDVWEYRTESERPPSNWTSALPSYLKERYKGSYLEFMQKKRNLDK